ncbi:MAG: putative Co/Zn/Cd cation transporter [Bacillales bacterium]|jgi:cation diffusion facilitator family transporter|nr:putative Co/Zn/Cd cation transporter [Bacillales bacterium]
MTNTKFQNVKKVLWAILMANVAVALIKIIVGTMIKSSSLTADGFHSIADGSSNIIGIIGIGLASKPVDEDHPYGHNKFETLSAMLISVMLFILAIKLILDAIIRIQHPISPKITTISLIALIITLVINILVSVIEYRKGKQMNSHILISDSLHTRSDVYVSIGVLISLICIRLGLPPIIDPIMCFVVACFIIHAAYEIISDNIGTLVDKAVLDQQKIKEIVMSFGQVKDSHKIRSRGSGDDLYIDMHLMTDPTMSIEQSHELVHHIEERLNAEFPQNIQIIAHLEPYWEDKTYNNDK